MRQTASEKGARESGMSEAADRAQHISDSAVTLVRNEGNLIPLAPASRACLVMVTERRISRLGQLMMLEFQRRGTGVFRRRPGRHNRRCRASIVHHAR